MIKGVKSFEDFHLWSIGGGKHCLTAHLKIDSNYNPQSLIKDSKGSSINIGQHIYEEIDEIALRHDICHTTV